MIILPKEEPVLKKLNSYYVNLQKLIEHCQGEFGSGGVHFESPTAEGLLFFDKDEMLNGVFASKEGEIEGQQALEILLGADDYNFEVSVFLIDPELVDFWAHIPKAKTIYKDLTTEFTDFEILFNKMRAEKLTGFFNIALNNGAGSALYFLSNGEIVGGSYSWDSAGGFGSSENLDLLFKKVKAAGGTFHVNEITSGKVSPGDEASISSGQPVSGGVLEPLEDLLGIVEGIVTKNRKIKDDFNLLLKNKFIQKANQYTFLDPFAAEFEYADHRITFTGTSSDKEIARGVVESVKELAEELGVLPQMLEAAGPWLQNHSKMLKESGIDF